MDPSLKQDSDYCRIFPRKTTAAHPLRSLSTQPARFGILRP